MGTVVWSADYKPFGEATITVSTITNNLRFPGQYYDAETGLNYNLNRDYNPALGRYIEADRLLSVFIYKSKSRFVIPFMLLTPAQLHNYVYVTNGPINWIDPWGLYKYSPTAGDPVDDATGKAMTCFETCSGSDITITAGKEGGHSTGSKHETGQACDVGKNSNPDLTTDTAKKCFTQCFSSTSYGQEEGNHYHFQTTPGKGGATGFADGVK